jgi:predicted nucleic acid-binding protein
MKKRYLIDSRIFIDHLCGRKKATQWLMALKDGEAAISSRSRSEILIVGKEEDENTLHLMLDQYPCLPESQRSSDRAAALFRLKKIDLHDACQISLAEENQLIYVTNQHKGLKNRKDKNLLILNT